MGALFYQDAVCQKWKTLDTPSTQPQYIDAVVLKSWKTLKETMTIYSAHSLKSKKTVPHPSLTNTNSPKSWQQTNTHWNVEILTEADGCWVGPPNPGKVGVCLATSWFEDDCAAPNKAKAGSFLAACWFEDDCAAPNPAKADCFDPPKLNVAGGLDGAKENPWDVEPELKENGFTVSELELAGVGVMLNVCCAGWAAVVTDVVLTAANWNDEAWPLGANWNAPAGVTEVVIDAVVAVFALKLNGAGAVVVDAAFAVKVKGAAAVVVVGAKVLTGKLKGNGAGAAVVSALEATVGFELDDAPNWNVGPDEAAASRPPWANDPDVDDADPKLTPAAAADGIENVNPDPIKQNKTPKVIKTLSYYVVSDCCHWGKVNVG